MHALLLFVHSLFRWVVILLGLYAVVAASGRRDARPGRWFAITLDIQFLLGLILYWLSPITSGAIANMGAAMQNRVIRFWAVEHVTSMVLALALAHIGVARARKGKGGAAVLFVLALLAILIGIPWPFLPYGRPLVPAP
ncbi:MAG TPA: hypothetical protein VHJ77_03810 [Vicinamibacterales bacterium]|jgi:hypothetical protein|nr:hypothetical protein [Vicinamibacterales bacterium]